MNTNTKPVALLRLAVLALVLQLAGAVISILDKLPSGSTHPVTTSRAWHGLIGGSGTALAPPLSTTVIFIVCIALAARSRRQQMIGTVGLLIAGVVFTAGLLSEPLARHALTFTSVDALKTALILLALIISLAISVLAARALHARHRQTGASPSGAHGNA